MFLHYMAWGDKEIISHHEDGNEVLVENARHQISDARHLTNRQIRNKFKRGWNRDVAMNARITAAEAEIATFRTVLTRLETAESEIATLKANQQKIQQSIQVICQAIDKLFDTGDHFTTRDCCQSDYYVFCLGRSTANVFADFIKEPAGTCNSCPDFLVP